MNFDTKKEPFFTYLIQSVKQGSSRGKRNGFNADGIDFVEKKRSAANTSPCNCYRQGGGCQITFF